MWLTECNIGGESVGELTRRAGEVDGRGSVEGICRLLEEREGEQFGRREESHGVSVCVCVEKC